MPFLQILGAVFKWFKSKPLLLMIIILGLMATNAKTLWNLDTAEDTLVEVREDLQVCEKDLAKSLEKIDDQNSSIIQWENAGKAAAEFARKQDQLSKQKELEWQKRINLLQSQKAPTEATEGLNWLFEKFQGVN